MPPRATGIPKSKAEIAKVSRKRFLISLGGGAVVLVLSILGLKAITDNTINIDVEKVRSFLTLDEIQLIYNIVFNYQQKYGRSSYQFYLLPPDPNIQPPLPEINPDDGTLVLTDSNPSYISINSHILRETDPAKKDLLLQRTVEFAMGQANENGQTVGFPDNFSNPITLKDGTTLDYIQGFTIYITVPQPNGKPIKQIVGKIEWGACVALANDFDPNFNDVFVPGGFPPQYFALGYLTSQILELRSDLIDIYGLAQRLQNNQLLDFIRIIVGKQSINDLNQSDIEQVMNWHQLAWNILNSTSDFNVVKAKVDVIVNDIKNYKGNSGGQLSDKLATGEA